MKTPRGAASAPRRAPTSDRLSGPRRTQVPRGERAAHPRGRRRRRRRRRRGPRRPRRGPRPAPRPRRRPCPAPRRGPPRRGGPRQQTSAVALRAARGRPPRGGGRGARRAARVGRLLPAAAAAAEPDLSATQFLAAHETTPGWYEVAAAGADAGRTGAGDGRPPQAPPPNAPQWYRMTDAGHPASGTDGRDDVEQPGGSVGASARRRSRRAAVFVCTGSCAGRASRLMRRSETKHRPPGAFSVPC